MPRYNTALIDGDVLLYSVARGVEKEARFDTDCHILYSDFTEAWPAMVHQIESVMDVVGAESLEIHISGKTNWRKIVMPTYKAHRKDVRKPLCFARLTEELRAKYPCVTIEGLEADDTLGLACRPGDIRVSLDKDFFAVPGSFARIAVDRSVEIHEISEDRARYYHMLQAFMGDRTDGYPGCPGVGEVIAKRKLDAVVETPGFMRRSEWCDAWNMMVAAYEKAGATQEDAIENFVVSKILDGSTGNYLVHKDARSVFVTLPYGLDFEVLLNNV